MRYGWLFERLGKDKNCLTDQPLLNGVARQIGVPLHVHLLENA